jgi:hypothetical protein
MITFIIRQHDRVPSISLDAVDEDGVAIDLAAFTSAKFFMRARGASELKVDAAATIEEPASEGKLRYDWGASDTDTAGVFWAEFECSTADGKKRTFPTIGQIRVEVIADLDGA